MKCIALNLANSNIVDYDPLKKKLLKDVKIIFDSFVCFSEDFVDTLGNCVVSIH